MRKKSWFEKLGALKFKFWVKAGPGSFKASHELSFENISLIQNLFVYISGTILIFKLIFKDVICVGGR